MESADPNNKPTTMDSGAGFITRVEELAYDLKVEEVMTRDIKVVTPSVLMKDVLELFREARISGAPVIKNSDLIGIISIEDLVRALRDSGRSELKASVADYMSPGVITVNSFDSIVEALKLFTKTKVGRLAVIDRDGQLAGMITKGDITRGLLSALQRDYQEEEVRRYRASHLFEDIVSDRTSLILRYTIKQGDFINGGAASSNIKRALLRLGANPQIARRCGIAIYEAEMNLIIHTTNGGEIRVEIEPHQIRMHTVDDGPGIEDVNLAMQPGYSTATAAVRELGFGAGMGLQNIKRFVDDMHLESTPAHSRLVMKPKPGSQEWELTREPAPGQGTRLTMKIFLTPEETLKEKYHFSKEGDS
jgi:CBS domain-containing protein/anti-sigma regulatory factor (Ser/Thr protein kinase)